MPLIPYKQIDKEFIRRIEEFLYANNALVFSDIELIQNCAGSINAELVLYIEFTDDNQIQVFVPLYRIRKGIRTLMDSTLPFDLPYGGSLSAISLNAESLVKRFGFGIRADIRLTTSPLSRIGVNPESNDVVTKLTALLDLTHSEADIWNIEIASKRRNMISKAIKKGYHISLTSSLEDFDKFWSILGSLHKRLGYKMLTKQYYQSMLSVLGSDRYFVALAYEDETLVSGALFIGNKYCYHYYKGATIENPPNDGQGELLQWESIKHMKKLGTRYYDLCVVDKEALPNIYAFKTGFSTNIVPFYQYSSDSCLSKAARMIKKSRFF